VLRRQAEADDDCPKADLWVPTKHPGGLVALLKVGDDFESFYEATHGRIAAALLASLRDRDAADEATDEAFARALGAWDRVSAMGNPAGWVYRVGLREGARRRRRAAVERLRWGRTSGVAPTQPLPDAELWDAVAALPRRQRQAIVLRFVADLPEADVATAMGVTRGAVSATLHQAKQSLHLSLSPPVARETEVASGG